MKDGENCNAAAWSACPICPRDEPPLACGAGLADGGEGVEEVGDLVDRRAGEGAGEVFGGDADGAGLLGQVFGPVRLLCGGLLAAGRGGGVWGTMLHRRVSMHHDARTCEYNAYIDSDPAELDRRRM